MNRFRAALSALFAPSSGEAEGRTAAPSVWSNVLSWGGVSAFQGAAAASGIPVTPERALSLTAYFAAVNRIATDVASLPLQVYRKRSDGGRDEARDHPAYDLLTSSPDGETTSMRWRQALMGHVLGWGNGYAEIASDNGGRPVGLYLLDPAETCPDRRPQDKRLYYRSGGTTLPPYRILHCAGFGCDGLKGYSAACVLREAIGLGIAAERYGAGFFGNGAKPSGVIQLAPGHKLQQTEADAFRQAWADLHAGGPRPALLQNGAEYKPISIPPEDAQFLQTRQFQVLEIARIFGVPPHKIGDYSQSHLANIEASNLDYLSTTIMPWCESVEQELNRKLFTAEERAAGYYAEHNLAAFLRGDSKARSEMYAALMGMTVLSPNDVARRENLNPIGPEGDKRYLSVQFQPLEAALNPPQPEPEQPLGGAAGPVAKRYNHNHGADGKFSSGAGAGKGKFVGKTVGKKEHVYAEAKEKVVARALGGAQLRDNEPLDVRVPKAGGGEHAIEVKTLLKGQKQSISVHDDALLRKVDYAAKTPGATFHTVVIDRRDKYEGGAHANNHSGNTIYYKRGSGRYSLSQMHPVKSVSELKALLDTPDRRLPEKARGALPSGKKVAALRKSADKAHASRLAKDRARKQRLKQEQGKNPS